jgi:DNA polymerase-3 subunit delta
MAASRTSTGASYDDLATAFTHGRFQPLYFFFGEEGFLMDELQALAVAHALQPHERDFNLDVVFGPEASAPAVLAQCAQYPMMAARRLIVVRGFDKLDQNILFKEYAERPSPHATVLLLCTGKPNLSAHPYRALKQHALWAEFAPLKDRQMPGWIERRFRHAGVEAESGAAQVLAEMAGADLRTVAGEVEKLACYVGDRRRVTRDDVLRAAGHSRDENPFQLQDAIVAGDARRALHIVDALLSQAGNRRGEALKLVGLLSAYAMRLWRLTGCLAQGLPEADMARQIGVPPYYLKDYVQAARRLGPGRIRQVFEALLAADAELKGASHRDERMILTLALRAMTSVPKARPPAARTIQAS